MFAGLRELGKVESTEISAFEIEVVRRVYPAVAVNIRVFEDDLAAESAEDVAFQVKAIEHGYLTVAIHIAGHTGCGFGYRTAFGALLHLFAVFDNPLFTRSMRLGGYFAAVGDFFVAAVAVCVAGVALFRAGGSLFVFKVRAAGVVFGVQFAVCFAADFADSFVFASSRSTGVGGNGFAADVADMVVVLIRVVGNSLSTEVTNVVVVIVYMVGDSFAADVADMIFVVVNMIGDSLAADVADVIGVIVYVVGDSFATSVADMVVVIVYVIGYSFSANVADVVVVAVNVVGDSFATSVTKVVVVIIHMIGDGFAANVTDVVVVIIHMIGDSLAADVTDMVVVAVNVVGDSFSADVTKVVMILIRVVGNGFTAEVALMVGVVVLMRARVCANGADTVLKLVVSFRDSYLAAAAPLLGMLGFGLIPDFLARVVFGVQFAVFLAADFANRFVFAGSRSAGAVLCFGIGAAFKCTVAGMSSVAVRYIITVSMLMHFQGYINTHCLSVFADIIEIPKAFVFGVKHNDTGCRIICAVIRINTHMFKFFIRQNLMHIKRH